MLRGRKGVAGVEKPVICKPYLYKGRTGIDIRIVDDSATVQDYTEALDQYILAGGFQRERSAVAYCEGCDICCRERIPLTSVDALLLKECVAPGLPLSGFLQRYGYIRVSGPVVDIALGRDWQDRCLFLNPETGKCRNYQVRPLVCRTYICTPLSPRAKKLRETVVNGGMDELVRLILVEQGEACFPVHEAEDPAIDKGDWPESVWTGRTSYSQLKLKDIVPERLWRELRKGEEDV